MSGAVVLWSKPSCVQCVAVKRALDGRGVAFEEKDLTGDPGALEVFKDLGFMQAPVLTIDGEAQFAGFNPGEIDRLFGKSPA